MGIILCATGNGAQSRTVQTAAVEKARAEQKSLVFVHVVDLRQMSDLEEALKPAALAELAWLGEAIMRLAQDRASRRGVHAGTQILYGSVTEALEGYMRDHPVDVLMMGAATDEGINSFAQHIRDDLGVDVQFIAAQ